MKEIFRKFVEFPLRVTNSIVCKLIEKKLQIKYCVYTLAFNKIIKFIN